MKIGIITYHRAHNYGAVLQAVALRFYLSKLGHDVYFIDYWPAYHNNIYKLFSFRKVLSRRSGFDYLMDFCHNFKEKVAKHKNYAEFIRRNIEPYCVTCEEVFDIVIHGSDQIWRKQPANGNQYNEVYFGDHENIKTSVNISYAASMGKLPSDKTDVSKVLNLVSNLSICSVRETDLFEFLKDNAINNIRTDVDPTLLLECTDWDKIIPTTPSSKRKYLLFYNLLENTFNFEDVKAFAAERGLEVITLLGFANQKETLNVVSSAGPVEFVNLIRNAEYVITSSFHGLVFSLLYSKQFYVSFNLNPQRALSILKSVGLENRFIEPNSLLPRMYDEINYEKVHQNLHDFKSQSQIFLKSLNS